MIKMPFPLRAYLAGLALAAFGASSAFAGPVTRIDFDNVRDKTDVRIQYQSSGVVFSCEGAPCVSFKGRNRVFARATPNTASSPNSVTPVYQGVAGVSDASTGRVVATFAVPVISVSVDAKSVLVPEPLNQTGYANMVAFDKNGAVVGTATGSQLNAFQTLTVKTQGAAIAKVSLGVTSPVAVAVFDNLVFEQGKKSPFGTILDR